MRFSRATRQHINIAVQLFGGRIVLLTGKIHTAVPEHRHADRIDNDAEMHGGKQQVDSEDAYTSLPGDLTA
jgi:hypothetical protein